MERPSAIVIVGAGAAGAMTAARLLEQATRVSTELAVTLVDPSALPGRGVAYSTTDDRHALNVRSGGMSAFPEDPGHFLRWSAGRIDPPLETDGFAPRHLYGQYLEDVLTTAAATARAAVPASVLVGRRDRAVALAADDHGLRVTLLGGDTLQADAVVLALGHLGIQTDWAPAGLRDAPGFVADPWAPGALAAVPDEGDVLLVGSGLTAVDCLTTLARSGRTVHATSRHGRLPAAHHQEPAAGMAPPTFATAAPGLAELRAVLARHIADAVRLHGDWRPAVDSLRPLTAALWAGLGEADRREFRDSDAGRWEVHRHRMPAATAARVRQATVEGRFVLHAASLTSATTASGRLQVELSDGTALQVSAVVNCTGPCDRPADSADPLVGDLLASGLARPGPLGIGFDTDPDGAALTADGERLGLWTLGPLRRGTLWETTAMPEIRHQAADLAVSLLPTAAPAATSAT